MTVFGRDTLITSYETILFGPNLAVGALKTLAKLQSKKYDDAHDAEPGKILHEMRFGEVGIRSGLFPYYGSADATPLFLILASELFHWTGIDEILKELRPYFIAAIDWIRRYGDLDGDGFVEYKKRSPRGLDNQGWKDSWNSILFSNGELAEPPIAMCEIQGYAYLAMNGFAEVAERVWDEKALASELSKAAGELKRNFNDSFWTDDGHYALALDKNKHKVDSLTSNIGHQLWTGIIDDGRVNATVDQLLAEDMFSGWGIRTMSSKDKGFNPIAYHNGTVWQR